MTLIFCVYYYIMFTFFMKTDVFLKRLKTKKETVVRVSYSIQDVVKALGITGIEHLLFAHVVTGCDTTSLIHRFGKTSILEKLKNSVD